MPHALKYIIIWTLAAAALFLPLLTLGPEFLFGSKDKIFYTTALDLYGKAMQEGDFYPRWLAEANGGQGTPAMIFYAPLAYFLTSLLFGWLAPIDDLVHLRLILGMAASQCLAAACCFVWLRRHVDRRFALAASILYVLFPYKFFYVWFHHNLAQLWALAWLPLLMVAAEHLMERRKQAVIFYGAVLAALFYTHPLTCMVFAPVAALYVTLFTKTARKRSLLLLAVAHAVGFGFSAPYLLPMVLNKPFIYSDAYTAGFYQVTNNLSHPDTWFSFYYLIIIGLTFALLRLGKENPNKIFYFFSGIVSFYWLMTTPLSRPLWESIPLLAYVQYPMMRLHSVILLCSTWVAAYGLERWFASPKPRPRLVSPYTALIAIVVCGWFMHAFLFKILLEDEAGKKRIIPYAYQKTMHDVYAITPLEYTTRWAEPQSLEKIQERAQEKLLLPISGDGDVEIIEQKNRKIVFEAHVTKYLTLRIKQWHFPGWQVRDEHEKFYTILGDGQGLMRIALPGGDHKITVELPWLYGEKAGWLLSLMTIAGIGLYYLNLKRPDSQL